MFNNMNIIRLFFEEPSREFNVREVARILKISPATASKKLKELARQGIIKERFDRIFNFYRASIDSEIYKDMKIYYNIRKLKDSGLISALNDFYLMPTVILFGSAASGMDVETSDIDLLVISENKKEFNGLEKYEAKLKRKLQIMACRKISDLGNAHLINNILSGITIQGVVEWTSLNASKKGLSGKQK